MAPVMPANTNPAGESERVVCSFCRTRVDPDAVESAAVPSNVRAFKHEVFHVWRCPDCRSLHCREVIELGRYYTNYPIVRVLNRATRHTFHNLLRRLTDHGYRPESRLLDYGCGWGVFLEHLWQSGYVNAIGYDPYSGVEALRNPACLEPAAFDYILLQDVLEHVEDGRALVAELDRYLKPGGCVLIGTPTADAISLADYPRYWTQLHPPYHLHIYSRAAVEALGTEAGWQVLTRYDRPYYDTRVRGLNAHAINMYQAFGDGTLDSLFDSVPPERLRRSMRYRVMARFGYWLKRNTGEAAIMFRKPASSGPHRNG